MGWQFDVGRCGQGTENEEREGWTRCKGLMCISSQARDIPNHEGHTEKAEKSTATCCKSHERQQRTQEYGVDGIYCTSLLGETWAESLAKKVIMEAEIDRTVEALGRTPCLDSTTYSADSIATATQVKVPLIFCAAHLPNAW